MGWRQKLKQASLPLFPEGTRRRRAAVAVYRALLRPDDWTLRSDPGMHLRIVWRRALARLGLRGLHPAMRGFDAMRQRHQGERCFITCTGPSLRIEDLERLRGEYTIGVNSILAAYPHTAWRPTYYAMVDIFNVGDFLYAHSDGPLCEREAFLHCRARLRRPTGREKYCLVSYLNHTRRRMRARDYLLSDDPGVCVYDCFSVTNMAIQLAVYLGFTRIYLLGADCDYDASQMHFIESEADDRLRQVDWIPEAVRMSIQGFEAARRFAEAHGVTVYNATRGGKLEVFERVDFDSLALRPAPGTDTRAGKADG